MQLNSKLHIAVSGLAASGKGTICRLYAMKQNMYYVDVGLVFRFAAYALNKKIFNSISEFTNGYNLKYWNYEWDGKFAYINCNSKKISQELLGQDISFLTATLSKNQNFFSVLSEISETIIQARDRVIADGRNVGISIMINADYRFHIISSINTRAKRRLDDYHKLNINASIDEVVAMLRERDELDQSRITNSIGPFIGSHVINNDGTIELAVENIYQIVQSNSII